MADQLKKVFLTGGTGLLGSYLATLLLKEHGEVYLLARSDARNSAAQRVAQALDFWDKGFFAKYRKNIHIFDGDIRKPELGLKAKQCAILGNNICEIIHAAADTNLTRPSAELRNVNLSGTKNVLRFAAKIQKYGKLKKVNHISTTFVCGDYRGTFKEKHLSVGQGFNNYYEQSKYEAEIAAGEFRKQGLWIDIYRSPIITGHSKTGKIMQFRNVYQFVDAIRLNIFKALPVQGYKIFLTPVDIVSQAILTIAKNTETRNKTYHPFINIPVSYRNVVNYSASVIHYPKPKIVKTCVPGNSGMSSIQKKLLHNISDAVNFNVNLDSSYTGKISSENGFAIDWDEKRCMTNAFKFYRSNVRNGKNK